MLKRPHRSTRPAPEPDAFSTSIAIRRLADRIASPMVILDKSGRIRFANPAAGTLLGGTAESMEGARVTQLVHGGDRRRLRDDLAEALAGRGIGVSGEYRIRAADGSWKTVAAVASSLADHSSSGEVLVSATDITEQRAHEEVLRDLALRDPTTGLGNRRALHQFLDDQSQGLAMAIAFVDIDRFRQINDCFGHSVGDIVLQAAGARLGALLPRGSMVAHFGADTFVIVLLGLAPERSIQLLWEVVGAISNPLFVSGHEFRLSATAGISTRDDASTPESMLRDADAALTCAKMRRRGGVEVFTEDVRSETVDRLAMETDLRHAVERKDFHLVFQPIVRLDDRRVEAREALLRWSRRGGDLVPPDTFIPVAEEVGLIVGIGEWVIDAVIGGMTPASVPRTSVNLSARQLLDPGLPNRVERLMKVWDVSPGKLAFEVTETVVIENFDLATESLNRLRGLGCPVGLDDFGTGYSSLGYLRRLPLDFLKLDQRLVADLDTDPQAARIAEMIVGLAESLSLATVGEGVERRSQADALAAMGCVYGQGWLFGSPAPS